MIALYVIIGILALIAVLSLVKINAVIDFYYKSEDNSIFIKYLFFKIKIFPSEKKPKKEEAKDKEEDKAPKKEKKKKDKPKKSALEWIDTVKSVYNAVKKDVLKLFGYLFKKTVTINEVKLDAVIGTGDPMYTGIAYGSACGIVYNALNALNVKRREVSIEADFDKTVFNGGIHTVIYTRLVHVYVLAAMLVVIGIKVLRRL